MKQFLLCVFVHSLFYVSYGNELPLPHLKEVIERVFPIDATTIATENALVHHFEQQEVPGPRAAVVLLLKDLRCGGKPCKQNSKWGACTYLDQAVRSVGSLTKPGSLLQKYPRYPILLYHSDWTSKDQKKLVDASGLRSSQAFWQRVSFGEDSLPPFLYDVNRTVSGWRRHHVDNDLSRETKQNIHGFGYMLMCRLYAGLIHHAPLARKLDYYLRVDGDSRLTSVGQDPFMAMSKLGKKYAHYGRGGYREIAGAAIALPATFAQLHPEFDIHHAHCENSLASVSCPTIATHHGVSSSSPMQKKKKPLQPHCHLNCALSFYSDSHEQLSMPVPLCTLASSSMKQQPTRTMDAQRCPAFYNNFEIVDMRAFRTPAQWHFFLLAERAHLFLCEYAPGRSTPGKCGGGGMGDALFRTIQVNSFLKPSEVLHLSAPAVVYKHPVPIASFCGPKGTKDNGPRVLSIAAAPAAAE